MKAFWFLFVYFLLTRSTLPYPQVPPSGEWQLLDVVCQETTKMSIAVYLTRPISDGLDYNNYKLSKKLRAISHLTEIDLIKSYLLKRAGKRVLNQN